MNLRFFLAFFLSGYLSSGLAVSTATLPQGVRSPSILFGRIDGLDQVYSSSGELFNRGSLNSISFDAKKLMSMSKEGKDLIATLNQFGNSGLGDQIHFGTLEVFTKPSIEYQAPVFAYGVTDRWTVGIGVPIVKYKNQFSFYHRPGNLEFYRSQFQGLSGELDQALNINLAEQAEQVAISKGYSPLSGRSQSFIGDIQFGSLYRKGEDGKTQTVFSQNLVLPTGPKYNPDDLLALNVFGRPSLELGLAVQIPMFKRTSIIPYASTVFPFETKIQMRIPLNENDSLPDISQKEWVTSQLGRSVTLGSEVEWAANKQWTFHSGLEMQSKETDKVTGSNPSRYDLLEKNTNSSFMKSRVLIQWSTVKSFIDKEIAIPMIASLEISEAFAGTNTERRQITELNTMLFF